jgi:hypothetical protein
MSAPAHTSPLCRKLILQHQVLGYLSSASAISFSRLAAMARSPRPRQTHHRQQLSHMRECHHNGKIHNIIKLSFHKCGMPPISVSHSELKRASGCAAPAGEEPLPQGLFKDKRVSGRGMHHALVRLRVRHRLGELAPSRPSSGKDCEAAAPAVASRFSQSSRT